MVLSDSIRAEIKQWMDLYPAGRQRSAILPALYVIQREFGFCPIDAQNELAGMLELEPAEVGAVVDFYHMLHTEPKGEYHVEVCTNVPCMLRGAGQCMHHFEEQLGVHHGETTADDQFSLDHMECLGSCGTAPMVSITERKTGQIRYFEELDTAANVEKVLTLVKSGTAFTTLERWTAAGDPELTGKAAGPYRIGGMETRFLTARVFAQDSHKLATYEADGGYVTAKRALTTLKPEEVLEQVKASGIRGRGGAGFPTGQKWSFLAPDFPRYLVVNADESEPGTFKDRILMEYDPHQLLEGILLSAYAIKAERAFIYIRGEYYFAYTRLVEALQEATAKGYLGEKIFGTDYSLKLVVHRGAGAYECGEETALLTSLEGYRGHPRMKPPFPAVKGLYAKPTIVNNVESIANVTHVMRHGVEWYRQFGTEKSPGMRIFCLSGNVKYPGLYELPHATPLREIIETYGGGPQVEGACNQGGGAWRAVDEDSHRQPVGHAHGLRSGGRGWLILGFGWGHCHRRAHLYGGRGTAHAGLLPRGELWEMHALSRGNRLAGEHPHPHGRGRRPGAGHRPAGPHHQVHRREELLSLWRGVGVGTPEQHRQVPAGICELRPADQSGRDRADHSHSSHLPARHRPGQHAAGQRHRAGG